LLDSLKDALLNKNRIPYSQTIANELRNNFNYYSLVKSNLLDKERNKQNPKRILLGIFLIIYEFGL
jgi:hypothetical protein